MEDDRKPHRVKLNLPRSAGGPLPIPDDAVVYIDGVPLREVTAVDIKCAAGELTEVTLTLWAQVEGTVDGDILVRGIDNQVVPLLKEPTT